MSDLYRDGETVTLVVHAVFLTRSVRGHLYEVIHASRVDGEKTVAAMPRTTVCHIVRQEPGGAQFTIAGRTYRATLTRLVPADDWTWPRDTADIRRFDTRDRWFTRDLQRLEYCT